MKKTALPDQCCANCRFWKEDKEEGTVGRTGQCLRYPPTVHYDPEDGAFSAWPFTEAEESCGEHANPTH